MIKIIDQCIYDYTDDDFMIEKPSELVYKLLEVIEEAGMLPPIPENEKEDWEQFFYQSDMYLDWEPEDE